MDEGNSIFRLLVYAVIVALLLFIFFAVFAPQYFWSEEPDRLIKTKLGAAETDLGHYHHGKTRFPEEFTVKAEGYESKSRSLVFECNSGVLCCPKGEDCEGKKAIEWDNQTDERFFSFKEEKPVEVSARCREEGFYICKVFIGEEPAQVDITSFEVSDTELDLMEKNWLKLKYKVENTGKQYMGGVRGIARLYKIKKLPFGQEPEKDLVKEFKDEIFSLGIGEEVEREIDIVIEGNGDYQIEFVSFEENDETNYETETIEIKASGIVEIGECIPGQTESEYYSEEKCRYFFPCEDCKSLVECERKWREQYSIPEEFKFELWKYDEISGSSKLKTPGETREECTRHCYPEFEIIEEISGFETPLDIMFVIDASGSMSDDIEEVKEVIETVYTGIGDRCTTQDTGEPCIRIGVYLFEGSFRDCYDAPSNPFYSACLRKERTRTTFTYDSYYYVVCDIVQIFLMGNYAAYCGATMKAENAGWCTGTENKMMGTERKTYYDFVPPTCRPSSTEFTRPLNGALPGQTSDIGFIPITSEMEKIVSALDEIIATQGEAEAWSDALYFVLSSDEMNWRENSEKAIILITDTNNNVQSANNLVGGIKSLNETALLAQEKNTRIFSLEAAGCDSTSYLITNAAARTLLSEYNLSIPAGSSGAACPGTDLQRISSQTGAVSVNYRNANELPEKILEIIIESVKKTTGEFGLRTCEEGEIPETCIEKCVLPWEEDCTECSCAQYYQENIEDYSLLDILFVVDSSESMQEAISPMKSSISQIISGVERECENAGIENCMRVSVRQVFGRSDSTDLLELTDNMNEAENTISGIVAGGGGDERDPWAGEALLSLWTDKWHAESKKLIFILTDSANNPEEIVSDDYISMIEASAREGMDRAIVELGDFAQKNKFKIFGFTAENTEAETQFDWLAGKTDGKTIKFNKGENFSEVIGQLLLNEVLDATDKQKCLDAQCETCAGLTVETSSVPLEWNYRYMCSHRTDDCKRFLSCYSSPRNISLEVCQSKWIEKIQEETGSEFEMTQDTEENWLFIEGTKFFEGNETMDEEWDECELPKITENCGSERFTWEEMPEGVDSYDTEIEEEPDEDTEEETEDEPEEELPQADKSELECLNELECYCDTGNEDFEYLERIKESEKPIDLLVVLDATRSMYQEGHEFGESFSELSNAMQEECLIDGEPCLKIGVLAIGGMGSTLTTRTIFQKLENPPPSLNSSLGLIPLSFEPRTMETNNGAISGLGYQEEDEPWLDALAYAVDPAISDFVGWRENSQKAILLIASENDKVSTESSSAVAGKLASNNIQFYGAVKNLTVGTDSPVDQAKLLGRKIFEYQTTTHDETGILWFENEDRPFTDILKMILKDSVENELINEQDKDVCTEEDDAIGEGCDSCVE